MARLPLRQRPALEDIERRILYSADTPGAMAAAPLLQQALEHKQDQPAPQDPRAATELVFIDERVQDAQALVADIQAQAAAGRAIEAILVRADEDGITAISQALAGRTNISAVHLVSHGASGSVQMGREALDGDSLLLRAGEIAAWGEPLGAGADLLVYGCDVASNAEGQALLQGLAALTGADVAGSEDLTGLARLGGNWTLEMQTGAIEAQLAFGLQLQAQWQGVLATYTVTNTNNTGAGSLRQAILDANTNAGADTINFTIAGAGLQTINLASALPSITGALTLNGYTQSDAAANTAATGSNAVIRVALNGSGAGAGANGLNFGAGSEGSTVRGLAIGGFTAAGVLTSVGGLTLSGNFIGSNAAGSTAIANNTGVSVAGTGATTIGSNALADRNLISGNTSNVVVSATGSVTIQGNLIGTDAGGTTAIAGASTTVGVSVSAGTAALVGGTAAGQGNAIAGGARGVVVTNTGTVASILGNTVAQTTTLGIDLANNGVTANDAGDPDTGPNALQNFPVLSATQTSSTDNAVAVQGTLNSTANSYYRIEFYASVAGTTTQEGRVYLGYANVATDASGNASISASLTGTVATGALISATATRANANYSSFFETSEFSAYRATTAMNVQVVTSTADTGAGSLRAAITAANAASGSTLIRFTIAGTGVHTITLASALPTLVKQVIIDGSTDDSFAARGNVPSIVLDLNGLAVSGLTLDTGSGGSTIRGLVINNYSGSASAIRILAGSAGNTIVGNYLGTVGADGLRTALPSGGDAIWILSANNRVGGTAAVERNVVGSDGNATYTILVNGSGADGNQILGNYIGVNASGTASFSGTQAGIWVNVGPANTRIENNLVSGSGDYGVAVNTTGAGTLVLNNRVGINAAGNATIATPTSGIRVFAASAGTVITGNWIGTSTLGGIVTNSGTSGIVVQGNRIGTDLAGTANWGGQQFGMRVDGNSHQIGGIGAGEGNVVAFSNQNGAAADGIAVLAGTGHAILRNLIYGTASGAGSLGIDLGNDGVTANDVGDPDTGANNLQNFPVLTLARTDGSGNLLINGTLTSTANSFYRIELFANSSNNASGYGEGQVYLGFVNVSTNASGNATISTTLSATVAAGSFISATATRSVAGFATFTDTSEFARSVVAISTVQNTLVVDTTSDASDGDTTSLSTLLASKGADGFISLREAIIAANNTANGSGGPDRIVFALAGTGAHTITLGSELPAITTQMTIDATTDDSFAANGNRPAITLLGDDASGWWGLQLYGTSGGSTIRGLIIKGFQTGIFVSSESAGNTIAGNYIGQLDAAGSIAGVQTNDFGVVLRGANTVVGGTTAADRNVISGNRGSNIGIEYADAIGNKVIGNYIGTDATGAIGAPASGDRGVYLSDGASGNQIGGTAANEGNLIAGNFSTGVDVLDGASAGNAILGNSIYANGSVGIDLASDGVTANDAGDADTGANNLQNFPVLTLVRTNASNQLDISGTLNSTASSYFRIEFFASSSADGSGYGEGQTYLGFLNVATNASGNATISGTLAADVAAGAIISATATKANAAYSSFTDTSEFARNVVAISTTAQTVLVVDTAADASSGANGDGDTTSLSTLLANKGTDGKISLREALIAVNNTPAGSLPVRINFNIAGDVVHTVTLGSALPLITKPVIIDGSTDTGSVAVNGGRPAIVLNANDTTGNALQLTSTAGGSTIRGLVITNYATAGISIDASSNGNTIVGNYIGTLGSAGNATASSNGGAYALYVAGSNNTIGGNTAADRNVIAQVAGTWTAHVTGSGNVILGNYFGTDATGNTRISANTRVLEITGSGSNNTIGGPGANDGNVIAGAATTDGALTVSTSGSGTLVQGNRIGVSASGAQLTGGGVSVFATATSVRLLGNWISSSLSQGISLSASGATVQGNRIGTDLAGTANWGALFNGITINGSNNMVGGAAPGQGNTIAFSNQNASTNDGIFVSGGTGNSLLGNAIYGTVGTGLGIDLGTNGVTANDAGDSDTGANNLQNFPVLTLARSNGSSTLELTGSLNTNTGSNYYRIEFFASPTGNVSGYGEGQIYLGSVNMATTGGTGTFSTTLTGVAVPVGYAITATATRSDSSYSTFITDTSEFALNLAATAVPNTAPTFQGLGSGWVGIDISAGSTDLFEKITVQADGKIILSGRANDTFALVRLLADGTLDTSFNGTGRIVLPFEAGLSSAYDVAVQSDGKIVAAGVGVVGGVSQFVVVRFNSNGTLDTSFSGDGKANVLFAGASLSEARSLTIQSDGKIVLAGSAQFSGTNQFAIARFNTDGTLDTGFSGDGMHTLAVGPSGSVATDVQVQADGKILLAGYTSNGSVFAVAMTRLTAAGVLDTGFGSAGFRTTDVGATGFQYTQAVLQGDGKIVVSANTAAGNFVLLRYDTNGTLDTSFDGDGRADTDFGGTDAAFGVVLQADGKILIGGYSVSGSGQFAVARYNTDGTLDTSFDGDGKRLVNLGVSAFGYGLALGKDGNALLAGFTSNAGAIDFAVASLRSDGATDTTFGPRAALTTTAAYTENAAPVVLDSDVQIYDAELRALNNYAGATLTLARNGGANAQDVFSGSGLLGTLTQGGSLVYDGTTIGTVTTNSAGTLVLTFNGNATQARVNDAMRLIAYANSSDTPPASVRIDWVFRDGNTGAQGSGGELSASNFTTVTITAVNDAPVITTTASALSYTENAAATAVDSGLTLSDGDSANLTGATVVISGNYANGQDVLAFTNQGGITGSWNAATGTLTLSGTATVALYQTALRSITYVNTSEDPSTTTRTVSFTATDGTTPGTAATRNITVTAVNDAPVVTTTGSVLSYTENAAATAIDSGLTLSDVDNANLSGATVAISANYANGQDVLAFTNQNGITGSWNATTGTLTLSGSATVAQYQTALRSVTYVNTSDNPSTTTRTVSFTVTDGTTPSTAATRNVSVTAVNDAPVVTTTGSALSYTENATTAVDAGLALSDADNANLSGATVRVTTNYVNGQDVLAFTNQSGITGSWNAATGTLTLTGSATVAQYQAALRSITYTNTSDTPSTATRTVSFTATDGTATSTAATRDVNVTAVNDAPVVTTTGSTLSYTENAAATVIDSGLTLSDVDNANLSGATVAISANYANGQDVLAFTNQAGITGSWNATTGTLTLSGTATLAQYQTALRSITYVNTSDNPSTATRTVSFTVTDGTTPSTAATRNVSVTAVNDAPVVTATGSTLSYTENAAATVIDSGLTLSDVDNANLTGATVAITGNYANGQDVLAFTNQNGITGSWNATTGTLTLSGSATVAQYQAALRSITYVNTSESPSTATRTLGFVVNDGTANSAEATRNISVTAVNDAPTITNGTTLTLSGTNQFTASSGKTVASLLADAGWADPDTGALQGLAVTAASGSGTWQYSTDGVSWVAFGSVSNAQALLLSATSLVRYLPGNQAETPAFSFAAWDRTSDTASTNAAPSYTNVGAGGGTSAFSSGRASAALTVSQVNRAPTDLALTPITHNVDSNAVTDIGSKTGTMATSATLADGSKVVVSADSGNIYYQLFAPSGSALTALTQMVFTEDIFYAERPAVAALPQGGFIVVVQALGYVGSGEAGTAIIGKVYDSGGHSIYVGPGDWSGAFQVSNSTAGNIDQDAPTVDVAGNGNITVSWNIRATGTVQQRVFTLLGPTVNENAAAGTVVADLLGTDYDSGDTLSYTIVGVSTDFSIVGNQLVVKAGANLDYETASTRTVTLRVTDSSGLSHDETFTITLNNVNDAPSGTDKTVTTLEDTAYTFAAADFGFSDVDGNALLSVRITTLPGAGTLALNGVAVSAGQVVSAANIASGLLKFTPAANASGATYASFTFQVQDDGGTANGGVNTDPTPNTMTVAVTAVNDAPAGTDKTVTTLEDTAHTFAVADFGFSDVDGNSLQGVKITTLPGAGTLTLSGVAVTAGQTISAANIASGLLQFTPAANANGAGYASFTFQVQDNGGTANGGIDLDPTPNTMTIAVTSVNDAPNGTDKTVTTNEDTVYTFSAADFGFSDVDGNSLQGVKITTLPGAGSLALNGVAVTLGQTVSAADISGGLLKFTPAANAHGAGYASFTFQVQDDGGTANGGVDTDPTPNTITVAVTSVNDAPSGTDKTVTTNEDTAYTFTVADFGFSDVDGNSLQGVKITTLPGAGALTLSGVAVTAGQMLSAANIASGLLKFTPAANVNGAGYASFTFQVQDDGGTANGGIDTDPTPNTITVAVTSVNDAPSGTDKTVTTNEDVAYTFTVADFGFSDTDGNSLQGVKITTLPAAGALTLNGVAVTLGQTISAANIASGLLTFTPAANANGASYASFTFQVQDDGGTANGGIDTDPTPHTITVAVASVNDAPAGTDKTVTTNEDLAYTFTAADFGFSDTDGNSLQGVKITTLPGAGALTLSGVAVTAGQTISTANIASGLLQFTPAANANGAAYASFTFQVQDDGGTANGGSDLDPTPNTMTVAVTSVNDAPNGTDKTVTTNEDTAYTFTVADFGFSDVDGNSLQGVKITTLPGAGTLALNGVAVTLGQTISATDIGGGLLTFTSAANANGAAYASFTFQVQDDGGTANGGADLDPTANTITVAVTSVNDAPSGTDKTVTTNEDTAHTFTVADFGFNDVDGNSLQGVKITTLPGAGALTLNGVAVTAGQTISAAHIASGLLQFTPAANANGAGYASFTFQVQDDGGIGNGGIDTDPTPNTITVAVTSVNDAPAGADKTVTTTEDTAYTFTAADFGFSDVDGNSLQGVKITTLPGAGMLALNGVAVIAGQTVSAANIASGLLRFTPAAHANGAGYASFTFQVQDDGGTANGGTDLDPTPRTMTVDVAPVNDAPVITSNGGGTSAAISVAENTTAVTTVVASDVDSPALSYTISGGTDAALFQIDSTTGVLRFIAAPDFENPLDANGDNIYDVVVQASDGLLTDTQTLAITVGNVNEASVGAVVDANAAPNQVTENAANGSLVGITASASDADGPDVVTYGLSDNAGGRFTINATTGVVTVANGSLLDYEAATSHQITVVATSSDGSSSSANFTITLADANETPVGAVTDVNAASNQVAENAANGTVVGITAQASDPDGTASVSYSLTNNAGGRFAIDATTGVVTVANGNLLDYETATSHGITVRATSSDGSTSDASFTITLTDVNEGPVGAATDANPATNQVAENAANGTAVGITALAVDPDGTATVSYSLTDNAGGRFTINATTGVVTVANGSLLNYEAANSHQITVLATSSDGSSSSTQFTIALADVDEAPVGAVTDVNAASNQVAENAASGTAVGITALATDPDGTATVRYSLSNDAGGRFAIDAVTGVVTVADGGLLDFETATSHLIRVLATSSDGSTSTADFSIALTDVNEAVIAPVVDTNPAPNRVAENAANGSTVGLTAHARDPDAGASVSYSLSDDAGGRFAINATTGVVTVANGSLLDYESATSHSVTVLATSTDGSTTSLSFTVQLGDENEFAIGPVTDSNAASNTVPEGAATGTAVGITASAVDRDGSNNTVRYVLLDDAGGRFAIDAATGVVSVANGQLLDYESATSHSITVVASSTDGSSSQSRFTITLTDVNEGPVGLATDTNTAPNTVTEHASNGSLVGITAQAVDADGTNSGISYTLSDDAGGRFAIDARTGVVTVANGSLLDYDTASSHTITVRASSQDGSFSMTNFVIALTDVNEHALGPVTDTNAAPDRVEEYAANGTVVGVTAHASDLDGTNNAVRYSLSDDAGGRFAINASTGVVTVANGSLLDSRLAASHDITVLATSADGSTSTVVLRIAVSAVPERPDMAPVFPRALTNVGVPDQQQPVMTVTASDPQNLPLSYAIVGGDDGAQFTIDADTGTLRFAAQPHYVSPQDANHDNRYEVLVRASNGRLSATHMVYVTVQGFIEQGSGPIVVTLVTPAEPTPDNTPQSAPASPGVQAPVDATPPEVQTATGGVVPEQERAPGTAPAPVVLQNVDLSAALQADPGGQHRDGFNVQTTRPLERRAEEVLELLVLHELYHPGSTGSAATGSGSSAMTTVRAAEPVIGHDGDGDSAQLATVDIDETLVGGLAISLGAAFWASRGSALLASLLAASPAWTTFDPLPVLTRRARTRDGAAAGRTPQHLIDLDDDSVLDDAPPHEDGEAQTVDAAAQDRPEPEKKA